MREIRNGSIAWENDGERQAYRIGVEDVCFIRCMDHVGVRQLNFEEHGQGECPVCQIVNLLAYGAPGHHVMRLVGNGDISAGKGRELLIDVLLGKIGLGDLPILNIGEPLVPEITAHSTIRRGRIETARWLAERSWFMTTMKIGMVEAVNELFEFFGIIIPCSHERLNEDGICRSCGADRRGIG